MKTVIIEKFGPPEVLKVTKREKPNPKDDEVLIRNYASSINTVDIMFRNANLPPVMFWSARVLFKPFARLAVGIRKPKLKYPGFDFAGEIIEVGKNVSNWTVGDRVYGYSDNGGSLAEFLCLPSSYEKLTTMPSNMSFQEAAAVPGGASPALTGLRDFGNLKANQKVLIIGASGGIGTFAVQIAKAMGAEVTGVCGPINLEMVKEIGAKFAIDYSKEDYTHGYIQYDVIFDAVGANSFSNCKKILTKDGVFVSNNPLNRKRHLYQLILNKQFKSGATSENAENLSVLRDWIEEGKIKSKIDTVYPMSEVSEAHRHYETGHARGRVVVSIE